MSNELHSGPGKRNKRIFRILKAFNRYFFPLRVKLALLLFTVIAIISYYFSRDLKLSLALAVLVVVLLWLLSGLPGGKVHIPVCYAEEDADNDSIWIIRR